MSINQSSSIKVYTIVVRTMLFAAALLYTPATTAHGNHDHGRDNLFDTAARADSLGTFLDVVTMAGLESTLKYRGPITLLAPSDAAFDALSTQELEQVMESEETLHTFIARHVIQKPMRMKSLASLGQMRSAAGDTRPVRVKPSGGFQIGDANVEAGNVECTNGMLHVIDRVLLPVPDSNPADAEVDHD